MNIRECERFESSLVAAAGGDVGATEHLQDCAVCAAGLREIRGLVALLGNHPREALLRPPSRRGWWSRWLHRSRGAARAAAVIGVLVLSAWGLFALTPVRQSGATLRGVPPVRFGPTSATRVADRWQVAFTSVRDATGYELTVLSLASGRRIVAEGAASPLAVPIAEIEALVRDGDAIWYLRAWDGAHLLAESAPLPVPPPGRPR